MNHAGVAPLSRRVQAAMTKFLEDATVNGAVNAKLWEAEAEICRGAAARLLNANTTENRLYEEYDTRDSHCGERY